MLSIYFYVHGVNPMFVTTLILYICFWGGVFELYHIWERKDLLIMYRGKGAVYGLLATVAWNIYHENDIYWDLTFLG